MSDEHDRRDPNVVCTALGADAEAMRCSDCARVTVRSAIAPANGRERTELAGPAGQAIRVFDPLVPVVDIAVASADADWFVDDGDDLFGD